MVIKHEYQNEDEKNKIISENSHLFLIEEQNIIEGNFLIFSDTLPEKEIVYVNVPQNELEISKQRIMDLELTIAEMMTF